MLYVNSRQQIFHCVTWINNMSLYYLTLNYRTKSKPNKARDWNHVSISMSHFVTSWVEWNIYMIYASVKCHHLGLLMACSLVCTIPFAEPMHTYFQLNPQRQTSVKFNQIHFYFRSKSMHLKMSSTKCWTFFQASTCCLVIYSARE